MFITVFINLLLLFKNNRFNSSLIIILLYTARDSILYRGINKMVFIIKFHQYWTSMKHTISKCSYSNNFRKSWIVIIRICKPTDSLRFILVPFTLELYFDELIFLNILVRICIRVTSVWCLNLEFSKLLFSIYIIMHAYRIHYLPIFSLECYGFIISKVL